ncbi:MAG: DNA polymerase I [Saprospiraceae bacterium]|nr:DNA polymerase I [Saprospiraceae bacterium]MDW8485152.1 DNA polymerase I [Saprospiraceae bacterium]
MKKLFLFDGHALIYRAHYAFIARPLFNSKGWNVSAIHGFVRTLWDTLLREQPTHLAVVFDPPGGTFRHERYESYKANREEQPEDITIALPWVEKIVRAMNLPVLVVPNYEADDVMGTLARQAAEQGFQVYLVTSDKDMGQLVSERIFLYKPGRQGSDVEIWGPNEVCERWGIRRVEQVVDMLGLMGDAVDNIPGLPGVGEKTAARLLAEYDSVEKVLQHTAHIKGKLGEILAQHGEQALMSKWLATIDTHAPVTFDEEAFKVKTFDREALLEIFKELEFRTLANDILKHPLAGRTGPSTQPVTAIQAKQGSLFEESSTPTDEHTPPQEIRRGVKNIYNTPHQYHLVETPEQRVELLQKLLTRKSVSYDSETTAIEPTQAELVGFSFAFKPHEAWYVPIPPDRTQAQAIVEEFRPFFENEHIEKVGQNLKYDAIVLKNYGVDLRGAFWDTMIAHYLLEPELRHNLSYLAETYLDYSPVKIEELIGKKGIHQGSMRDVPLEQIKEYAAEDADLALQLKNCLEPQLEAGGPHLLRLFHTVECPLIKVLADMEFAGVRIDADFLKEYSKELAAAIQAIEEKILRDVGHPFNLASPKQVGEVLFERLKIPYPGKKMKSGQYSTDEEVLSSLAREYPICADILQHRALQKLRSTYVEALPALVNPRTGRVHSSFNQALTATGRLSSQNPNLQNIPIRTPEGRRVREAFIPRDDEHVILSADYSQIELRIIAHISHEEAMIEAFQKNQDIHQTTAARVFGVPIEQVTPEQRRIAKTVNFSIIYGAGASNLSNQLGIKRTQAKELIDNYFTQYPGLKRYMETMVDFARANGYVETLLGRRRYLRDIHSRNGASRSMAERMAINTPIQGTAADLIKVAMVNIWKAMRAAQLRSHLILQVHDELVFDARRDEVETLKALVQEKMTSALPDLRVPIIVEIGVGNNWLEAH